MSARYHPEGPTPHVGPDMARISLSKIRCAVVPYECSVRRMEQVDYEKLLDQIIRLEGIRLDPYRDAKGRLIVADGEHAQAAGVGGGTITVLEADVRRV